MPHKRKKTFEIFLPEYESVTVVAKDEVEAAEMLKNILGRDTIPSKTVFCEIYMGADFPRSEKYLSLLTE